MSIVCVMRKEDFSALEHRCSISVWDSWDTARHRTAFICTQASETGMASSRIRVCLPASSAPIAQPETDPHCRWGNQPLALANTTHRPLMSFPLTDKGSWWIFFPPSPSAGCAPAVAQQAILKTAEPLLCNRTNKNRTTAPWHQQTQVTWSHLSLQSLLTPSRAPLILSKVQPIRRGLTSSLWSVILN